MDSVASLVAGMALAALGGEVFVRGAVALAHRLDVPVSVVGVTVAAFATSAPEMAVGVNAALAGTPQVAAGDALGSNVVNIALVLGVVIVLVPLRVERADLQRDLPLAAVAPLLLAALIWDGRLSRLDGLALILVFAAWVTTTVRGAWRRRAAREGGTTPRGRAAVLLVVGGVLLLVAGRLVVVGARGIGESLGLDPFLVGATLVALGTSMPELATAVVARLRGHGDLGAGTVIGSNIFNSLWIVGSVAVLRPFSLPLGEVAVAVVSGTLAALLLIPSRSWMLGRARGGVLLLGYAGYAGVLLAIHG